MLRKIGACGFGVLCLVAASSFVGLSAAEEAPTIGELEAFAGTAGEPAAVDVAGAIAEAEAKLAEGKPYVARDMAMELLKHELSAEQRRRVNKVAAEADKAIKAAAPPVEVAPDVASSADRLLAEYVRKLQVEKEARQRQAAEYVKEAKHQLYVESNAERAYELAKNALVLDPANAEAEDLKVEAGLQLGVESDVIRSTVETQVDIQPVRKQAALQALSNLIESAKQLNAEGQHEEALKQLRRARANVAALSVYMDMSSERRKVENLIADAEGDYEEARLELSVAQKEEAKGEAAEKIRRISEVKQKEQARRFDDVVELIEDVRFAEARGVIDDMNYEDPSDELVPVLLKRLSDAENDYEMKRINAARERGDLKLGQWESDQEAMPEDIMVFPDKAFWTDVIIERPELALGWRDEMDERTETLYPSTRLAVERSAEDQAVYDHLDDQVPLSFSETPLPSVVEFLQQITEVDYVLVDRDQLALSSVTLTRETSLRTALDLITEQTDSAWKVDRGAIAVGPPEALRDYEWRAYEIQDLLISISDTAQVTGLGGTAGRGGISGGRGGFTTGSTGTGGGLSGSSTRGQFARFAPSDGAAAQFGTGTTGGTTGGRAGGTRGGFGGGRGGGGGVSAGTGATTTIAHAEYLIGFLKQTCGYDEGTWLNPDGGNDLFLGAGGVGAVGDAGVGMGTGVGGRPGGFGPAGGGFGPAGGGFGPAGAAGGGFGFGPGAAAGGAAPGAAGMGLEGLPSGRVLWNPDVPGKMIVIQTAEVHECIEDVLRELRSSLAIQVQVDVRFLSVATDFLREVGFNWDNFILHPDEFDSVGNMDGFGIGSGAYGGYGSWVQPDGIVLTVEDENQLFLTGLEFGFGHTFGDPETEFDDETNTITFEKAALTGAPFMGTGVPFFGDTNSGLNLNFGWGGSALDLSGSLRLAHERREAKTLSAPRITLTNGQAGFITVSTDRDYVSTYEVEDSILIPTIDTVSDAVDLAVRPVVSADRRYVFLELTPTILSTDLTNTADFTTFVGQPGGEGGAAGEAVENFITLPEITDQTLGTTVGVPDRGILIVGGLTESTRQHEEAGVPILSKIPILKRLFSAEGRQLSRYTLFILAHPRVVILGEEEHATLD
jgi:Flp pilus assembly secretin CpaC